MTMYKSFILALLVCTGLYAAPSAAQSSTSLTLEQAVLKVQQKTGGKVLSAESRQFGRQLEYRIKVLTPEGHVRVISVSSKVDTRPASSQSTKSSPGKHAGH